MTVSEGARNDLFLSLRGILKGVRDDEAISRLIAFSYQPLALYGLLFHFCSVILLFDF